MSRRFFSIAVLVALLSGALLAWALPALARTGRHSGRPAAAETATRASTGATTTAASTGTHTTATTAKTTSKHAAKRGKSLPKSWVGSWSKPYSVAAPVTSDLIAPGLALSATGEVAVTSGLTDEDAPQNARADVIGGTVSGRFSPRDALDGLQQTLAAGYLDNRLVLLTATSGSSDSCCTSASIQQEAGSGFGTPATIVTGLDGATTGQLVPVRGGLLAAVDNQAGITVARSDATGDFSAVEQLTPDTTTPALMAASSLHDGGAVVAWTAPTSSAEDNGTATVTTATTSVSAFNQPRNRSIYFSTDGPSGLPGAPRWALTVPVNREIAGLAVAAHGGGATVAWTESWYQGFKYRSAVFWADLRAGARVHQLSSASTVAVGVSLASGGDGRQVLAWQACSSSAGTCTAAAALRPHGSAWGPVQSLGAVDAASFPVVTQSALGQSLVGWIAAGRVFAAAAAPGATSFYAPATIARAGAESELALGFGAAKRAVAVWVQGTYAQKLVGASFSP